MGKASQALNRLLHGTIAICLSCMATFVFANVVLRYFFHSAITWAEEASRYLFIWLIFMGAIIAFKENVHLGVDTLVVRLSAKNRRRLFILNNTLLAITMGLCADGAWKLVQLTTTQVSAALRLPLCYVYGAGLVCSVAMFFIALNNLYRLLANKVKEDELVMTADSEDKEILGQALGETDEGAKKP